MFSIDTNRRLRVSEGLESTLNLNAPRAEGVPLLHVCDKTDPWFNDHTRVVEQR